MASIKGGATSPATSAPSGTQTYMTEIKKARFLSGTYSEVSAVAFGRLMPRPMPVRSRQITSSVGVAAYAVASDARPTVNMPQIKMGLRPTLSPSGATADVPTSMPKTDAERAKEKAAASVLHSSVSEGTASAMV
jgi:hypothetical protein